jgi:glucose-6-phosphate isomerase
MRSKDISISFEKTCLFSQRDTQHVFQQLFPYVNHLKKVALQGDYAADEASINVPFDKRMLAEVESLAKKKGSKRLRYVVVVGIGGSCLGTQAVYEALLKYRTQNDVPHLLFADTVSSDMIGSIISLLKKNARHVNEILLNIVSKSGMTPETVSNTEMLVAQLKKHLKLKNDSLVVTTDEGSKLWQLGEKCGIDMLSIPAKVGGRYSFFTPVGLFPLALVGVDIRSLQKGAAIMREVCLNADIGSNPALTAAVIAYLAYSKGMPIHNLFFFDPRFEALGKMYRQLMAESIAKEYDIQGKKVNVGITPIVSIGSTDLHSMAPLYFDGPYDKFTTFVLNERIKKQPALPKQGGFSSLVSGISQRSLDEIMQAISQGVLAAYRQRKRPYGVVSFPEISEYSLGQFIQMTMMEMMFLGRIFSVNPFDQPGVEGYKVETRKILSLRGLARELHFRSAVSDSS